MANTGRPHVVGSRFDDTTYKKLQKRAQSRGISVSEYVYRTMRKHLVKRKAA